MLVKIGVYCLRGGGHYATYDDDDFCCAGKGPDLFMDVTDWPLHALPNWLQERVVEQRKIASQRRLPVE